MKLRIIIVVCLLTVLSGVMYAQDFGIPLEETTVIQPENANQLREIARLGRGTANVAQGSSC